MYLGDEKSENFCEFNKNNEKSETNMNLNSHYHLIERNTSGLNIMSGVKSLVCDLNGIIIAEMVYRCMICDLVFETIPEVQIHYQSKHIDNSSDSTQNNPKTKKSNNSTNISFLNTFQLPSDTIPDNSSPQTLTFNVPSGLKTLQQQFESSSKGNPQKKKSTKLLANDSKTKIGVNNKSRVLGHLTAPTIKSGFITCEICGATKFYKYTQRRFGVYSCVGCAKFYSKYLLKPVIYKMCENLGKCNLKVSECEPNGRCKACLIHKCKSKFIIDPKKLNTYRTEPKTNSFKSNSKQISTKDFNKSTKSTKPLNIEPKSKSSSSVSVKSKNETENIHKMSTSLTSGKKSKSDKIQVKNINEKNGVFNKKSINTNSISKKTSDKTSLTLKMKKNIIKSSEFQLKKSKNQTVCRKCFGSKLRDCSHTESGSETNKFKIKDKTKISSKKISV